MRFLYFFILISLASLSFSQSPSRFFTDATGKFRIRAVIIDLNETNVKLRKSDGTEVEVPITRLSESDQKYLQEQYRRYKEMAGDFPIGTAVEIFSTGSWHPGKVLAVEPGKYFITFDKYSEAWNKWVTVDQLRLPATESNQSTEAAAAPVNMEDVAKPTLPASLPLGRVITQAGLPQLKLQSGMGEPFLFDHAWIQSRFFVQAIGGSQWNQAVVLDQAAGLREGVIELPCVDPNQPIDAFLLSHRKQRLLMQQGSILVCVNLAAGQLDWVLPSLGEDDLRPLAISDSGKRLVFGVFSPKGDRQGIRVFQIDGLEATILWQWRPEPPELKVTAAHAATWLDDERLLVVDETSCSEWIPDQRLLRSVVRADANSILQASTSGKQLGLVVMNRLMMLSTAAPINMLTYSMDLPAKTSCLSFPTVGPLAVASGGDQAATVDLRSGKIAPISNDLLNSKHAHWVDPQRMLVDGQWIVALDRPQPLARIVTNQASPSALPWTWAVGEKLVLIDAVRGRLMLRNLSSLLPLDAAAEPTRPVYAVDRGAAVSISISGSAVGPYQEQVEENLRSIISENGWSFDANSPLVLSGNIESYTETMDYDVTGLFVGKKTERITPTYYRYTLGLRKGPELYYSKGRSTLATSITGLPSGKTVEQVVTERSRLQPDMIRSASMPAQIEVKKKGPAYKLIDISQISVQ